MRLLLLEDDDRIARDVMATLKAAGYSVEREIDGEEGWFKGDTEDYDAVILDLGLPSLDGLTILKRWRANGRTMPVLILTARGSWSERVDGIDSAQTITSRSPFTWRSCSPGSEPSCGARRAKVRPSSRTDRFLSIRGKCACR